MSASDSKDNDTTAIPYSNFASACLKTGVAATSYMALHRFLQLSQIKIGQGKQSVNISMILSLVNVAVSGYTGLRVLTTEEFGHDIVNTYPSWLDRGLSAFGGYALYDLSYMLTHGKNDPALLLHHLAGVIGSIASMSVKSLSYFPGATLFTELSLVSVYWLQHVKAHPVKYGTNTVIAAHLFRVLSTLIFRTFLIPYASWSFYKAVKRQLAKSSRSISMGEHIKQRVPRWGSIATMTNLSIFSVLNLWWTLQICERAQKEIAFVLKRRPFISS